MHHLLKERESRGVSEATFQPMLNVVECGGALPKEMEKSDYMERFCTIKHIYRTEHLPRQSFLWWHRVSNALYIKSKQGCVGG